MLKILDDEAAMSRCNTCERTQKCHPIMISPNQTCNCASQMKHRCIEFKRSSATFGDPLCSLGRREQLNLVSAFLDGSLVYGENLEKSESLRDRRSGKGLLILQSNGLLPQDPTPKPADCLDFKENQRCFRAGDDRVNQNPALMGMHTLLVREHNRVATILSSLNPEWNDETVYQEARRVVVSLIQHISFNEYVPILLGPTITRQFDLLPDRGTKYFAKYNPNVDPRVANEVLLNK
jgi:peroxidase